MNKLYLNLRNSLFRYLLPVGCLLFWGLPAAAQSGSNARITIHADEQPVIRILNRIGEQSGCSIILRDNDVDPDLKVSLHVDNATLGTALRQLLSRTDLTYQIDGRMISVFRPRRSVPALPGTRKVQGVVIDEQKRPVTGATIVLPQFPTVGTTTASDGSFCLQLPVGADRLEISCIGYEKQQVTLPADAGRTLEIVLQDDVQTLENVVVVGYGVQRKSVVTAAISSVKGDDLRRVTGTRIDNVLKGMVSGVNITQSSGQPGSGVRVRIRGVGTINDSNPLYIVDGMPVSSNIDYLNPADILSVEVLKDAASAAIYGARGANGVILVTTRQGNKGRTSVDYSFSYGWQSPWRTKDVLNAHEYAVMMNEMNMNSGLSPIYENPAALGKGTNWQKELFNYNAPVVEHQASVSGGNDKVNYYLSFGYLYNEGIIGGDVNRSNYDRYSVRANTNYTLFEKSEQRFFRSARAGVNMAYSRTVSRSIGENSERGSVLGSAVSMSPIMGVYAGNPEEVLNEHPTAVTDFSGRVFAIAGDNFGNMVNPIAQLHLPGDKSAADKLIGNIWGEIELYKGLKFKSSYGTELVFSSNDGYQMPYYLGRYTYADRSSVWSSMERLFTWQVENTLTYDCTLGERHQLTVLLGQSAQSSHSQNVGGSSYDISDPSQPWIDTTESDDNSRSAWGAPSPDHRLLSYFGRVSYNYDERYMAEFTLRRDGSSNFGPAHKWATFPSVSVGWNLTNEPFMANRPKALSSLKLRASWGLNGNESIGSFHYISTVTGGADYILGPEGLNTLVPGATPSGYPNDGLKWEESEQFDVGIDASFFGNRLSLTVDYFNKRTNGMLMTVPLPQYIGNSRPYGNVGDMKNSGVEINLRYLFQVSDVSFDIGGNATYISNRLIRLGNQNGWANYDTVLGNIGTITRAENGEPFPFFYGMRTAGIFQTADEVADYVNSRGEMLQPDARPGDVRFVDCNGDGTIDDADRVKIGKGAPDWTLGFNLAVAWKGIDLGAFFNATIGNDIFDASYRSDYPYLNMPRHMLDRWTGPGSSNRIPRLSRNVDAANWQSSDLYVHDGSFLRLRSLQLGYSFPAALLHKVHIERLRLWVGAENLWTLTSYEGFDPEISSGGTSLGVDRGVYPTARIFTIGANITF